MIPARQLRNRSRSIFQGATYRQIECFKGDNLCLASWSLSPSSNVDAGGTIDAAVTVYNGALSIMESDPDYCGDAENGNPGYQFSVHVATEWGAHQVVDSTCLGVQAIGVNSAEYDFQFTAPDENGTYWIDTWMVLPGSNETHQADRKEIVVQGGAGDDFDPGLVGVDGCFIDRGTIDIEVGQTANINVTFLNENDIEAILDATVLVGGHEADTDYRLTVPAGSTRSRSYTIGGFGASYPEGYQDVDILLENVGAN